MKIYSIKNVGIGISLLSVTSIVEIESLAANSKLKKFIPYFKKWMLEAKLT